MALAAIMSGHEFLKELRADPSLNDSVVFVLTTSRAEEDVTQAYERNVAGYMVKEDMGASFERGIDRLKSYWHIVELSQKVRHRHF